jgi:hypothetical protein
MCIHTYIYIYIYIYIYYFKVWEVFMANAAEQEVAELESAGELVRAHCLQIVANKPF